MCKHTFIAHKICCTFNSTFICELLALGCMLIRVLFRSAPGSVLFRSVYVLFIEYLHLSTLRYIIIKIKLKYTYVNIQYIYIYIYIPRYTYDCTLHMLSKFIIQFLIVFQICFKQKIDLVCSREYFNIVCNKLYEGIRSPTALQVSSLVGRNLPRRAPVTFVTVMSTKFRNEV